MKKSISDTTRETLLQLAADAGRQAAENALQSGRAVTGLNDDGQLETIQPDFEKLAKLLDSLFEHWRLTDAERQEILGVAEPGLAVFGATELAGLLAAKAETSARAGHLLAIHALLRTLFPENLDLVYSWPRSPNRAFDERAPLEVCKTSFEGVISVRRYLEQKVQGQITPQRRPKYSISELMAECDPNAPMPQVSGWEEMRPVGREILPPYEDKNER